MKNLIKKVKFVKQGSGLETINGGKIWRSWNLRKGFIGLERLTGM